MLLTNDELLDIHKKAVKKGFDCTTVYWAGKEYLLESDGLHTTHKSNAPDLAITVLPKGAIVNSIVIGKLIKDKNMFPDLLAVDIARKTHNKRGVKRRETK